MLFYILVSLLCQFFFVIKYQKQMSLIGHNDPNIKSANYNLMSNKEIRINLIHSHSMDLKTSEFSLQLILNQNKSKIKIAFTGESVYIIIKRDIMDLTLSTIQSVQNSNIQNPLIMNNFSSGVQHRTSVLSHYAPYDPRDEGQLFNDLVHPSAQQTINLMSVYLSNLDAKRDQSTNHYKISTKLENCLSQLQNMFIYWNKFIDRSKKDEWLYTKQFPALHQNCHMLVETVKLFVMEILLGDKATFRKLQQLYNNILFTQQFFEKRIDNFEAYQKASRQRQLKEIQNKRIKNMQNQAKGKQVDHKKTDILVDGYVQNKIPQFRKTIQNQLDFLQIEDNIEEKIQIGLNKMLGMLNKKSF